MSGKEVILLPAPMNAKKLQPKKGKKFPATVQRAGNRPIRIGRTLVGYGDYTEAKGRKAYDKKKAKKARRKAARKEIGTSAAKGDWWNTLSSIGSVVGPILGKAALTAITGFGDYSVDTNTLTARVTGGAIGGNIPIMENSHCANIIRHREYIGTVNGSTGSFSLTSYPINPGLPTSFPWLAPIAACYTRYRWRGLIFEYVPLSSDYAATSLLGFVAMGTQYNPLDANWQDKRSMLNAEYSGEEKPSRTLVHPIECAKNQLSIDEYFIRTGPVPTGADQRFYDIGELSVAVGSNTTSGQLGELWATYEIEFYQPKLAATSTTSSLLYVGGSLSPSTGNWFGTQTSRKGNMSGATFNANTFNFPPTIASGSYQVTLAWYDLTARVIAAEPTLVFNNCSLGTDLSQQFAPWAGTTSNGYIKTIQCNITAANASINISNLSATFPASSVTFVVNLLEDAATPLTVVESVRELGLLAEDSSSESEEIEDIKSELAVLRNMVLKLASGTVCSL